MTYATILVSLEAGRSNAPLLRVAQYVADRFQAGVIGTTACMPLQILYGDGYIDGELFEQDRAGIEKDTAAAEAEFRDAMGNGRTIVNWRSAVPLGSLADHLAREACRADLILTTASSDESFNASRQIHAGDLIMQAGRPVLVAGPATDSFRLDRVIVGWKDTREARRAVADALPLLKIASYVSVIEIAAADDLGGARSRLDDIAGWLRRHGVTAGVDARQARGGDEDGLDVAADGCQADIVVAGAYGHSRLREWALGGITRSLLRHPVRSCFVSH